MSQDFGRDEYIKVKRLRLHVLGFGNRVAEHGKKCEILNPKTLSLSSVSANKGLTRFILR